MNDHKLVFSGDVEPEFVEKNGATPSPDAQIYETNQGDWAVADAV